MVHVTMEIAVREFTDKSLIEIKNAKHISC